MFLRDERNFPVGCIAMHREGAYISYQLATLNPADRFDRKIARQVALGRLVERPIKVAIFEDSMIKIMRSIMVDIANATSTPNRSKKAATRWLVSGKS